MSSFAKMELLGRAGDVINIKVNNEKNTKIATFKVGVINIHGEVQWHKVAVKDQYIVNNVIENYVKPNCMVLVKGNLVINQWTDDFGNQKVGYEVMATEVYSFMSHKSEKYNNVT